MENKDVTIKLYEDIIRYIENDAEIAIPIERFFNEDGKVLLEILCQ